KHFQRKSVLITLPLIWIGLSVVAAVNQKDITKQDLFPLPLAYNPKQDIILNSESITKQSSTGVRIVNDKEASIGKAFEFFSGANKQIKPYPKVYAEMRFTAPAGRYFVWLRGQSDIDSEMTDSIWLQVDHQIGSAQGSVHLGNWNSFYPIGVYAWASEVHIPIIILLKHTGDHTIRIQPRQIPHRIDQIWLSR
ncbi:MAG: hypothetical protein GY751_14370, partial [Bacteroidetes bacterium]|nr:hypothetical protein [Bacteroidota bacterium]